VTGRIVYSRQWGRPLIYDGEALRLCPVDTPGTVFADQAEAEAAIQASITHYAALAERCGLRPVIAEDDYVFEDPTLERRIKQLARRARFEAEQAARALNEGAA